jgi:acyl-CoA thioester hydrolase
MLWVNNRTGEDRDAESSALFFSPFVSSQMALEPSWIDYNGHLNMAYYHVLFDRAVDEGFAMCGLGPSYLREQKCSFFVVESRIRYKRELSRNDRVRVKLQLVDHDDKRMHYWMDMHHATEGWLAASCENLSIHVDMTTRKASPFPEDIKSRLSLMRDTHALLPMPDGFGDGIRMRRSVQ